MTLSTATLDVLFQAAAPPAERPGTLLDHADPDELQRQGLDHFGRGDIAAALPLFQAAAHGSDSPEAWNNLGVARLALGAASEAEEAFTRALAKRPAYAEALNNRARARQARGELTGALADFHLALTAADGPFAAAVLHNRGTLRQLTGDLAGAVADFDDALSRAGDNVNTLVNRGQAKKDLGDLDGALADLNRALELAAPAEGAPVYHARGGAFVRRGDFGAAIADYDRALALDPEYTAAYISRGSARYHRLDPGAVADYRTALRLDSAGATRELLRVLAEDAQARAEEVLDNCDQHLRINPRDALAHARRGLTLVLLGRAEEAAPNLTAFRELLPSCVGFCDAILEALGG